MEELKGYMNKINPDILLTFGLDEEYGHSEDIVTGAMVTELLLKEGWVDKYPLYFPVDNKEEVIDEDELSYTDRKDINLKAIYSDQYEQMMIDAAKCYVTQFTPDDTQKLIEQPIKNKVNTKYFRRYIVSQKTRTEFFNY